MQELESRERELSRAIVEKAGTGRRGISVEPLNIIDIKIMIMIISDGMRIQI